MSHIATTIIALLIGVVFGFFLGFLVAQVPHR